MDNVRDVIFVLEKVLHTTIATNVYHCYKVYLYHCYRDTQLLEASLADNINP